MQGHNRRTFLKTGLGAGTGLALAGAAAPGFAADGCSGMSREEFDVYIERFNNNDPSFIDFYHPEVVLELGETQIRGPQGICDFYAPVKRHIRERLEVADYIANAQGIAAELPTVFECYEDWEDSFWGRPIKAGEVLRIVSFVHYRLEDGKFRHIKSARYRMLNDWRMEG